MTHVFSQEGLAMGQQCRTRRVGHLCLVPSEKGSVSFASSLIIYCEAYKRKQSVSVPHKQKGVGLIKTVLHEDRTSSPETPHECFKPFIFKGEGRTVSLVGLKMSVQ